MVTRKDRCCITAPACTACLGVAMLVFSACASSSAQQGGTSSPQRAAASSAPAAVRIGVVDLQKVLIETEAGKKARESLNTFMKNRQAVIELEEKDLKRMEEDLIKQASVLSATAKKDREDHLRRRVMEFQQRANDLNREVQEKQKEVLEDFRDKAERMVGKIAQQMGLTMVMEKGRGAPTVYSDSSLDISAKVIEEFNKTGL
ncbi:MAG: OmpH family outer membrane protein [Nitrospiraceae bacterium]|nr:OmpH family outer membrane protein [Nitrospiraceae bacterium]